MDYIPEKQDLQEIISALNWAVIDGEENGLPRMGSRR